VATKVPKIEPFGDLAGSWFEQYRAFPMRRYVAPADIAAAAENKRAHHKGTPILSL
jgi:hypothetical protein